MNRTQRILFVSHSASRNGATILLLDLLRWLRVNSDYSLAVLVNGTGDLVDEFQRLAPTTVWRNPAFFLKAFPTRVKETWTPQIEECALELWMQGRSYDLVYCNTSAVAPFVPVLLRRTRNMLWHIHEMEYALRLTMSEEQIRQFFPQATRFIVVSEAVRDVMTKRFKVPAEKIDLVNGFVHVPNLTPDETRSRRRDIRRKLGWSEEAFVVGGCGALGWRKGTDVFLQIAERMCNREGDGPTRFLWVGGSEIRDEMLRFEHDVRALALKDRCRCVPTTADVMDYYRAMDVFALTSREDPFPLVMLEAGACELPTVCFAGSGGGSEYVGEDAGLIAPYLDVVGFATHLEKLRDLPEMRHRLGASASQKVRTQHVIESQGPRILESIKGCLAHI